MAWTVLLSSLDRSRQQLDRFCVAVPTNRVAIYCAKGCHNCCHLAVNCSFPEAVALAKTLTSVQKKALYEKIPRLIQISGQADSLIQFLRLFRQQLGGCPLLDSVMGSCTVYPQRPFSCRALLSTRNSSWCAIDFADLHPQEKAAFLSSLDPELVAFPTHYLAQPQDLGLELETMSMASMREAFGVSLRGNLLYQLWLELEYQLSDVIPLGFTATRDFLKNKQLDLHFLLQLQGDED